MKTLQLKNTRALCLNILISIVILTIPFYAQRIALLNTSLSVLTINLVVLSITLFITSRKRIIAVFKKEYLLWLFAALFIVSFIPSLLLNPNAHGIGVFFEWLLMPAITGFLLHAYIQSAAHTFKTVRNTLLFTLFIISVIAVTYFILDIKTFDGRLSAFYPSPNHLALFITPIIPLLIAQFFNLKRIPSKIVYLSIFILSLFVLFFTNSFISSASLIISLSFITLIYVQKKKLLLSILLMFFIIISIIISHKITSIELNSTHNPLFSRAEIWTVAIHHIQTNTFLNTNHIDSFGQIYLEAQPFYAPYNTWSAPTPHNLFLTLWISSGFITVLFFCLLCSRWLYITFHFYKKTKNATILFYVAALLIILLSGIFDTPFWKNDLSLLFWIIFILGINQELIKT